MTGTTKSKRRQIIEAWMEGYKNWHPGTCAAYRAPDCHHVVVGVKAPEPWTNEDTNFFFSQWDGVAKSGEFEVHDWLEDEEQNKTAIYFTLDMYFQDNLGIDPYKGIYVIIFHFNKAQDAITKFVEFVDNGNTHNILRKVNEGRAKLGQGPLEYPGSKPR